MFDFLSNVGVQLVAFFSGLSLTTIVALVIYFCIKGAWDKTLKKVNLEKFSEDLANKQTERIKEVSFKQNIQPIVESELKRITENYDNRLLEELTKTQEKYNNLILVLEKFYAYFEDSLVSESKKEELKEAIENAKEEAPISNETETEEIIIDEPKTAPEPKEKPKKAKIER